MHKNIYPLLLVLLCLCCDRDGNELPRIFPPQPIILTGYQSNQALVRLLLTDQSDDWRKESKIEIRNLSGTVISGLTFHIEGCKTAQDHSYSCGNVYTYQMTSGETIAIGGNKMITINEDFFFRDSLKNNLYITELSPIADNLTIPVGFHSNTQVDYITADPSEVFYGSGRCFVSIDNDIVVRYSLYRRGNAAAELKDVIGKISRVTIVNARLDQRKASDSFDFLTGELQQSGKVLLTPDNVTNVKSIIVTLN